MAAASTAEVLAAWSGLGYNRRALALRRAGTLLAAEGWPRDADGLERLPGIGRTPPAPSPALAFGRAGGSGGHQRAPLAGPPLRPAAAAPAARSCRRSPTPWRPPTPRDGRRGRRLDARQHGVRRQGLHVAARRPATPARSRDGCPSRDRGGGRAGPAPAGLRRLGARRARAAAARALGRQPATPSRWPGRERVAGGHELDGLLDRLEREGLVHRPRRWLRLGGGSRPAAAATIGS